MRKTGMRYVYRSMLLLLILIERLLERKKMGGKEHRGRKNREAHAGCRLRSLSIVRPNKFPLKRIEGKRDSSVRSIDDCQGRR